MNRFLLKSAILAAAVWFPVATAYPQSTTMRFDVPFAFAAGDRHLPSGQYLVRWDPNSNAILVQRLGGESTFLPLANPAAPAASSALGVLRFHQYGDRYFIRGIQRAGTDRREWPASKAEIECSKAKAPRVVALGGL